MSKPAANAPFVACWTDVLTPRWIRFRHLLAGNGKIHSDLAADAMEWTAGERVLDVGCGFGESCLEWAERVGPQGAVVGIDCGPDFVAIAEHERADAGVEQVEYRVADVESCALEPEAYDLAFSRFGMMFCRSPVRMLRNVAGALRPGGRLYGIVWQAIDENPCWREAEKIAQRHLPMPGEDAPNCGPGPFSMANPDTVRRMLDAAGFEDARFTSLEGEVMLGRTIEEAVDYQSLVGPAGYIIRENGARGEEAMPTVREDLAAFYRTVAREDGSVWLPSKSWLLSARKPA